MALVTFIIGLFTGCFLGMLVMGLASAARANDIELTKGGWRDGNDDDDDD